MVDWRQSIAKLEYLFIDKSPHHQSLPFCYWAPLSPPFFISEPIDLYSTAQCFEFNEISLKCCAIQNNLVFQTHAHSTDSIHINMCAKVKVPMKRVLEPLKLAPVRETSLKAYCIVLQSAVIMVIIWRIAVMLLFLCILSCLVHLPIENKSLWRL